MATLAEQALTDIVALPRCVAVKENAPGGVPNDALTLAVTQAAALVQEELGATVDGDDAPAVMFTIYHTLQWLLTTGVGEKMGAVANALVDIWGPKWEQVKRARRAANHRVSFAVVDTTDFDAENFPYRS